MSSRNCSVGKCTVDETQNCRRKEYFRGDIFNCGSKSYPDLEHSAPIKWGENHFKCRFSRWLLMGNVSLMVLNSKSDCKIFKNTKDLQLQLKSLNTHNYVKMLNPLGGNKKTKTQQRFQMELWRSVHYCKLWSHSILVSILHVTKMTMVPVQRKGIGCNLNVWNIHISFVYFSRKIHNETVI